jgi:hypothetical protein
MQKLINFLRALAIIALLVFAVFIYGAIKTTVSGPDTERQINTFRTAHPAPWIETPALSDYGTAVLLYRKQSGKKWEYEGIVLDYPSYPKRQFSLPKEAQRFLVEYDHGKWVFKEQKAATAPR